MRAAVRAVRDRAPRSDGVRGARDRLDRRWSRRHRRGRCHGSSRATRFAAVRRARVAPADRRSRIARAARRGRRRSRSGPLQLVPRRRLDAVRVRDHAANASASTPWRGAMNATAHLDATRAALSSLESQLGELDRWGRRIAVRLTEGGRLLAAGNGGSAAEAQHLTAELVGRYATERQPLSAIALHADSSSFTAIANDYGPEASFARQVEAHGRRDD